jgi:peptidylprolyl isomerase
MKLKIFTILIVALAFGSSNAQTKRTAKAPVKRTAVKKTMSTPETSLSSGAVKTPSGLIYLITRKGTGVQPKAGQTVSVHYTGTLTDGTKFDSSRDRGQPYEFPLGQGQVIKGWDEGIARMHVGDQAVLVIPPSMGYGPEGFAGVIPPNATLIFIVELVNVKGQ